MGTRAAHAPPLERTGCVPGGLLTWVPNQDEVVAGRYRIRRVAPFRWELTFRGRMLSEHRRCSMAQVAGELHHRGVLRRADLIKWGTLAAVGLGAAVVFVGLRGPWLILGTVGGLWASFIGIARFVAALTGNLLDPYRRRDPWEPEDWWNRNP